MVGKGIQTSDGIHANNRFASRQRSARHRAKSGGAMGLLQFVECLCALFQAHEGLLGRLRRCAIRFTLRIGERDAVTGGGQDS